MKIALGKNKFALIDIDDGDYDKVKNKKWYSIKHGFTFYAITTGKKTILLHRLIMNAKENETIDHIDRNDLNNRKSNLRIVNTSYNLQNRKTWSKTKLKGVSFNKNLNKFVSLIYKDKIRYFLGFYDNKRIVAIAYNLKAKELYGKDVMINKINNIKEHEIKLIKTYRFKKRICKYKGVSKHKNKYRANIFYKDKQIHLGLFDTQEQAALAYNKFVVEKNLNRKLNKI